VVFRAADRVFDVGGLDVEAAEHLSNVGVVVQADNGLAFDVGEQLRHFLELFPAKVDAVAGGFPIRRIRVEKAVFAVVRSNRALTEIDN